MFDRDQEIFPIEGMDVEPFLVVRNGGVVDDVAFLAKFPCGKLAPLIMSVDAAEVLQVNLAILLDRIDQANKVDS